MFGWFNRKSTDNSELLHRLEKRLDTCEHNLQLEKAANDQKLLEYADLAEKMRRLYLRIARRAKIEEEQTSEEVKAPENETREIDNRKIRELIEIQHLGQ